jgi:hypothetical protein
MTARVKWLCFAERRFSGEVRSWNESNLTEDTGVGMCPSAPPVSLDLAESSSFDTFRVQCGDIQNRRGGTVLAFVLYMAQLIEGPKERTF